MTEPFDDKPLQEAVERLAELRPAGLPGIVVVGSLAIVQQRLHVLDGGGESQRPNGGAVAVERHHVFAPGRAIAKHEDLAPAFGAQVEQFVAGAAQEAGEIEVARLERGLRRSPLSYSPVQLTLDVLLKKKGLGDQRSKDPLMRHFAEQQAELLQADAHGDRRNEETLSKRPGEAVKRLVVSSRDHSRSPMWHAMRGISTKGG